MPSEMRDTYSGAELNKAGRGALMSRRSVLVTGAATAMVPAAALATRRPVTDPAALIPKTSMGSLFNFMRMFAGLHGSSVFTNEGLIYGKVPGQLPKPLFGYLAVLEIRVAQVSPGLFRSEQKEAMICLDIQTRLPLNHWTNVYNGENQATLGYVSPTNVYYFDRTGSAMREPPHANGSTRDWRSSSTDIWVTESSYSSFPASITEAEFPRSYAGPERLSVDILTFRAKASHFANKQLTSVPVQLTMLSDTPWPLWMMMGKSPGGCLWHGFGQKYAQFRNLPIPNRKAIDNAYPGFLEDPWGFASVEWGTVVQMRRLRAEGKL